VISAPKGIKKHIFGAVLFSLSAITALLAKTICFELDIFYVAICIVGANLFLHDTMQKNLHEVSRHMGSPLLRRNDRANGEFWFNTRRLAISNHKENR
jgi:hypothetical protein